jgi:hypothetical protein
MNEKQKEKISLQSKNDFDETDPSLSVNHPE